MCKVFKDTISKCGITLKEDADPPLLQQEEGLIIEQLENTFQDNETKRGSFLESLKTYCNNDDLFRQALFPCHIYKTKTDLSSTYKITQECVFGILLRVDCLQITIIDLILERLSACVIDAQYESWIKLILHSLRCLPFFKDINSLTKKLLEALEVADFSAQLEILTGIPSIIPENKHDKVAEQLNSFLNEKCELNAAIVECLNSLNISSDCRNIITDNILKNLQTKNSLKCFPVLFEFVISECKVNALPEVLQKCRNALDILLSSTSLDFVSIKHMTINEIIRLTSIHKHLLDGWITMVTNIKHHSHHKAVDVFLFIMLHEHTTKQKRRMVESLFKKHISSRILRQSHLEKSNNYLLPYIFDNHSYIQSLIKLINCCFQFSLKEIKNNNDKIIRDFLCELCEQIFCSDGMNEMNRRHVLHNLMVLVGQKTAAQTVLAILKHLCERNSLKNHQLQAMGLLEFVNCLSLPEVRQVFEILCQLTCTEDNSYKDEVHMVIRKQLSSCKHNSMQVGIIAAVVMANFLVYMEEEDVDITDEPIDIGELPAGPVQDAATLLNLARITGRSSPELLGLFYDQISHMVFASKYQNSVFIQWLFSTITNDFQDIYIIEKENVDPVLDLALEAHMSLNTTEELPDQFSVNIAGLTNSSEGHIVYLSPFFRTLRLLHTKLNNGDLSNIDALLGSAILMPPLSDIEHCSNDQIKYICDCLFHCINWFREVISAFITQTNKSLRFKLLDRVVNLIDLEELLKQTMKFVPEHKLPNSYFHESRNINVPKTNRSSKASTSKKKVTSNETVSTSHNNTTACTSQAIATQPAAKRRKLTTTKSSDDRTFTFREMDTDLITLLKYKIKFQDDTLSTTQHSQSTTISLKIFRFVLTDFIEKMKLIINNKSTGLTMIGAIKTLDLINDCQKSLPRINYHLLVIRKTLSDLFKANDDRYDIEDLHTESSVELKQCFGLCLEYIHILFSWSGFHETKNLNLLRDCVKCIQLEDRPDTSTQITQRNSSVLKLLEGLIEQLSKCNPYCMNIEAAVSLVKTMQVLSTLNENANVMKMIVTMSQQLLGRRWYDLRGNIHTGKAFCDNLEVLVRTYLNGANIKTLLALVGKLQNQVENLRTKEDYLFVLGSIDKSNFYVLFQCVCVSLKHKIQCELKSATNSEHLLLWKNVGLTMQGLITILKIHKARSGYRVFMIISTAILKVFISSGIPIFEIMLRGYTDQVVEILRIMQTTTRFVHNLCCDAKEQRDNVLLSKIPMFKLVLETLIYKVKALLVANDYSAAFWMGNLKNRNLDGDVILSQNTLINETVNDKNEAILDMIAMDSDEELFIDDNESGNNISDQISNDDVSVESEVF